MTATQRRIVLAARPQGMPRADDFRLEHVPLPEPGPNEVLVRNVWLSLDPYVRARLDEGDSYASGLALGEVIVGGTVGVVIESRDPAVAIGDVVEGPGGWQEYATLRLEDPSTLAPGVLPTRKLPARLRPASLALGILGMPGLTAYVGLNDYARPRAGETLVVSSASGTVGSMVGQLAGSLRARRVGIAGGAEKCRLACTESGFDACVDYRASDFETQLARACPAGIDVYFDNVGGAVTDGCFELLNERARIVVCGQLAGYNAEEAVTRIDRLPRWLSRILVRRLNVSGFIVSDHWHRYDAFLAATLPLIEGGALRYRETVYRGLERAPEAFIGLLTGANLGKTLVQVSADPIAPS
jgi:NADPH-dependent curcumin reductase CurA